MIRTPSLAVAFMLLTSSLASANLASDASASLNTYRHNVRPAPVKNITFRTEYDAQAHCHTGTVLWRAPNTNVWHHLHEGHRSKSDVFMCKSK